MRSKENSQGAGCLPWFIGAYLGVLAVVFLGAIAYEVTGHGINIWSKEDVAATSYTTLPRDLRPGWDAFLYVMEHGQYDSANCERKYDDLDTCY